MNDRFGEWKRCVAVVFIFFSAAGCVTTGPRVSKAELEAVESELRVKQLAFQYGQYERASEILVKMLKQLPAGEAEGKYPYVGLMWSELKGKKNKFIRQFLNPTREEGVAVVAVVRQSPAEQAGVLRGDVIRRMNGKEIRKFKHVSKVLKNLQFGDSLEIVVNRQGEKLTLNVVPEWLPVETKVKLVELEGQVNANTNGKDIYVSYALLNQVQSDDELAGVLAHELAHRVRGHIPKLRVGAVASGVAMVTLAVASEAFAPGSGSIFTRAADPVNKIFQTAYTRQLEREADFYGIQYAQKAGYDYAKITDFHERIAITMPSALTEKFLASHPSHPERIVRIQKTAALLSHPEHIDPMTGLLKEGTWNEAE